MDDQVKAVTSTFTDGVNVDFESPLSSANAHLYNEALALLEGRLHSAVSGSQLTVDVAWSPNCIDNRCYDAVGIAAVVDFLFVMSYDLRSQIYDLSDCQASANSPIRRVEEGLRNYTRLGVKPSQLVLGVPWYAYDYQCDNGTDPRAERCPIAHVPFEGAPWLGRGGYADHLRGRGGAAEGVDDGQAMERHVRDPVVQRRAGQQDTSGHRSVTAFRLLGDTGLTSALPASLEADAALLCCCAAAVCWRVCVCVQVWMDDVESLSVKYEMAKRMGLRGVGMWTADFLNYSQPIVNTTKEMWQAMKIVVGQMKETVGSRTAGRGAERGAGGVRV